MSLTNLPTPFNTPEAVDAFVLTWAAKYEDKRPRDILRLQLDLAKVEDAIEWTPEVTGFWIESWLRVRERDTIARYVPIHNCLRNLGLYGDEATEIPATMKRARPYFADRPFEAELWAGIFNHWVDRCDHANVLFSYVFYDQDNRRLFPPEHPLWHGLLDACGKAVTMHLHKTHPEPDLAQALQDDCWEILAYMYGKERANTLKTLGYAPEDHILMGKGLNTQGCLSGIKLI